ncbi:hypothetical protein [Bacillus sp. 03113]|uniref:hypothetical protein n=1 Tax=Bacillus sp. 03113 TaxID=2578211 RepID=UPI001141C9A6|nr:hypothetical protein [Bacillus sp. 03113]
MSQSYYPLETSPILTELQWSKIAKHWHGTGVLFGVMNNLEVYADSTGMQVKSKSGAAWIEGHYYESDTLEILPIGAADSVNPRIDRVVVRLDWTANTILLAVLQGTPAVSPSAPSLTQNSARWEIPLVQVRVDASVSTIAANKVTDEREDARKLALRHQPEWNILVLQNGWNGTGNGNAEPRYFKDEFGLVHLKGTIWGGATADWTIIATLPDGYKPYERLRFPTINSDTGTNTKAAYIVIETDGTVKIKNVQWADFLELNLPPFLV